MRGLTINERGAACRIDAFASHWIRGSTPSSPITISTKDLPVRVPCAKNHTGTHLDRGACRTGVNAGGEAGTVSFNCNPTVAMTVPNLKDFSTLRFLALTYASLRHSIVRHHRWRRWEPCPCLSGVCCAKSGPDMHALALLPSGRHG